MNIARSGLFLVLGLSGCTTGFQEAPTSLPLLLHQRDPGTFTLQEEWHGVVTVVSIGGDLEHDHQINPPREVRVDAITIGEDGIWIGRIVSNRFWTKGFTMDYQMMQNLPDPAEITGITKSEMLESVLGEPQFQRGSGFSTGLSLHTSKRWRFFTIEFEDRISVIEIIAFISKQKEADVWQVTGIMVSQGSLTQVANQAR